MKKIVLGLALCLTAAAAHASPSETVSLRNSEDGNYLVVGEFTAQAPILMAWEVLTDYAGLTRTVDSMVSSQVWEAEGGDKLVEQVARGGFAFFKKSVKVRLRVKEQFLRRIDFEDQPGGMFKVYRGSWVLEAAEGGVRVRYSLTANRGALAAEGLERWAFRREAKSLLRQLCAEVERRGKAMRIVQAEASVSAPLAQLGGSHARN